MIPALLRATNLVFLKTACNVFPRGKLAFKKLQDLKNAATLAIAILVENTNEDCFGNIFSENFNKNHCKNCRNGIRNFLHLPGLKKFLQKHYVLFENDYEHLTGYDTLSSKTGNGAHLKDAAPRNLIKKDADQEKDTDELQISTIKEHLHDSLLSIASKLLSSEQVTLDQLSSEEHYLWNSYNNADIYKFLTGKDNTIPEFQFDWITPEPAFRLSGNLQDLITQQPQQPQQLPVPPAQPLQPQPAQPQQPPAPPTPLATPGSERMLRNKVPVDYKELHTGIKKKCKSLRRKAQAVVTKLAPTAFSPKN
jgi:hypothetical protein